MYMDTCTWTHRHTHTPLVKLWEEIVDVSK